MTDDENQPILPADASAPEFAPVVMARNRHDGWTPERQAAFIKALTVTGSVGPAAKMVGMSRKSAYALRDRPNAGEFSWAWDTAISAGRARLFDYMFDRAINGVTTITLKMGGAIDVSHGKDGHLVATQLKVPLPGQNPFKARKGMS